MIIKYRYKDKLFTRKELEDYFWEVIYPKDYDYYLDFDDWFPGDFEEEVIHTKKDSAAVVALNTLDRYFYKMRHSCENCIFVNDFKNDYNTCRICQFLIKNERK